MPPHSYKKNRKEIEKNMKHMKKVGMAFMVLIVVSAMVSAGLIPFFGQIKTTAERKQAVTIDGQPFNMPLEHEIGAEDERCCFTYEHTINNNYCEGLWLDWTHQYPEGVEVIVSETGSCCDHILETLVIEALDGQAEWDDFEVKVDGTLVYTYDAQGGNPEDWLAHTIDLTPFQLQCCGKHVIYIECTAESAWANHDTYGQLAIDYIGLYCEGQVLCDEVDIGDTTSEAGHSLCGWGPIEPATSGGAYGGIDDCRVTWEPGSGSDDSKRGSSVVLECADCYEPSECDCDAEPMEMPFYLEAGESLDICYAIKFLPLASDGTYHISSKLILVEPMEP